VRRSHTRFGEKSEIEPAIPARKRDFASRSRRQTPYFFFDFLAVFFFVAFFAVFFFAALAIDISPIGFEIAGRSLVERTARAMVSHRVRSMPLSQVRPRIMRARDNDNDDATSSPSAPPSHSRCANIGKLTHVT
jgi:hypothetical protein